MASSVNLCCPPLERLSAFSLFLSFIIHSLGERISGLAKDLICSPASFGIFLTFNGAANEIARLMDLFHDARKDRRAAINLSRALT